ncbi:hypothetical protein ACFL14_02175 [Patescibacteria group bacterium]
MKEELLNNLKNLSDFLANSELDIVYCLPGKGLISLYDLLTHVIIDVGAIFPVLFSKDLREISIDPDVDSVTKTNLRRDPAEGECPQGAVVRFAAGILPEWELEPITQHLDSCEECSRLYSLITDFSFMSKKPARPA